ncbi:MAG: hypothetical protein WCY41_00940 [Candidatus Micrarchaeia archaeon]
MFVFQMSTQKPLEQQKPQEQQFSTRIFTGKDAQRILQGVSQVSEQMLSKVHPRPDGF